MKSLVVIFAATAALSGALLSTACNAGDSAGAPTPPHAENPKDDKPAQEPEGTRSFRMGFTGFTYDITLEALTASRKFVRENGVGWSPRMAT